MMNAMTPSGQLADDAAPAGAEFEGEIREFIRKDAPWRRRGEPAGDAPGESISMLVQRVAGASINEIDNIIDELNTMRDYLRSEGERVQREVAGYAGLNQTAATSIKTIAESMLQWRDAVSAPPFRG